jgi:aldose 1-epimerase
VSAAAGGREGFTLANRGGVEIDFVARGGTITSIRVPDRSGRVADVVPGFDTADEYAGDTRYMGALIGRFANRIAGGRFSLDGVEYSLPLNDGENHLHGGPCGFSAKAWRVAPFQHQGVTGAVLAMESEAGDQGYPGRLLTRVLYALDDDNAFTVSYSAVTDAPTVVNLTQHSYFNLAGHDAGDILGHELEIDATYVTPVDERMIPTGAFRGVRGGSAFDFLTPHRIGERIDDDDEQLRVAGGYDHNFVLNHSLDPSRRGAPAFAARLRDPASGRTLEISTTEPGLQVYTGNAFDRGHPGKGGYAYPRHAAVALETQHFPDSPNQPQFPSTVLRPGEEFLSTTVYRFSTT